MQKREWALETRKGVTFFLGGGGGGRGAFLFAWSGFLLARGLRKENLTLKCFSSVVSPISAMSRTAVWYRFAPCSVVSEIGSVQFSSV